MGAGPVSATSSAVLNALERLLEASRRDDAVARDVVRSLLKDPAVQQDRELAAALALALLGIPDDNRPTR